jgi:hypothetical protein
MKLRLATCLILASACVHAETIFNWSSGTHSGTATFSTQADAGGGFDLVIAVTNTSGSQAGLVTDVVTALFFNLSGAPGALKMQSGTATDGLINAQGTTIVAGSVGANICAPDSPAPGCSPTQPGGWETRFNASGLLSGSDYGIGTAGLNIFNGNASTGVDGANYGVVSAAGIGAGNTGFNNDKPYTFETGTFVLSGLTTDQINITNVLANYGTSTDVNFAATTPTPEPATGLGLGSGLIALGLLLRRKLS